MKSQNHSLFIMLSALLLITVFVLSDSIAVQEVFKEMDGNMDGKITLSEFEKNMKEHSFQMLDMDDNTKMEKDKSNPCENITDREKHVVKFERMDKDKDRKISFFEYSDYSDKEINLEEAFMGLDRDGNNSLAPDEITVRPCLKMITIKFK